MKRMLIVCCTRQRPELAENMLLSVVNTATECDIVFCMDAGDPSGGKYRVVLQNGNIEIKPHIKRTNYTTTAFINAAFKIYPNYEFYSVSNDDVDYETNGWDIALMNKEKISYGDDKCQGEKMPSISVIDGDIIRALGWLQLPTLTHLYGDAVWKAIGEKLKIMHFNKNVITNHKHFLYNKRTKSDVIYQRTNSREMYIRDGAMFRDWVQHHLVNDCEKIRKIL